MNLLAPAVALITFTILSISLRSLLLKLCSFVSADDSDCVSNLCLSKNKSKLACFLDGAAIVCAKNSKRSGNQSNILTILTHYLTQHSRD